MTGFVQHSCVIKRDRRGMCEYVPCMCGTHPPAPRQSPQHGCVCVFCSPCAWCYLLGVAFQQPEGITYSDHLKMFGPLKGLSHQLVMCSHLYDASWKRSIEPNGENLMSPPPPKTWPLVTQCENSFSWYLPQWHLDPPMYMVNFLGNYMCKLLRGWFEVISSLNQNNKVPPVLHFCAGPIPCMWSPDPLTHGLFISRLQLAHHK